MLKFHSVTLWISLVILVSYMLLIFQYARRSNMLLLEVKGYYGGHFFYGNRVTLQKRVASSLKIKALGSLSDR